ncbi:MAG TPA: SDR family oxidoreductase [Ktedonobacterales bacterium]
MMAQLENLYSLDGMTAVVTGGTGVLGGAMAHGLARAGVKVGVLSRHRDTADAVVGDIETARGEGLALITDVLDRGQLEQARNTVIDRWGRLDILINAAGGNMRAATESDDSNFFQIPPDALDKVVALNLQGTMWSSQVFGEAMARAGRGCIVNISSMAAERALTGVPGYGAAKAGVENFTRWRAVELARTYGEGLRVNAIAPGFFISHQNHDLLLDKDDRLTQRGQTIIDHTPAGRFGGLDDLIGTLVWLCSPGASFVNGVVVPVDGGFSAFSGV